MPNRDIEFSRSTGEEVVRELAYRTMNSARRLEDKDQDEDGPTRKLLDAMVGAAANVGYESKLPSDSLVRLVLDIPFNAALMAAIERGGDGGPADAAMLSHLMTHNLMLDIMMLAMVRMEHIHEEDSTGLSDEEQATLNKLAESWDNEDK